ncbi:MAG: ABC transporter substrate-binding protein [Thermomicrobiales bacterium]
MAARSRPDLAESFEISDDGLTYTFQLEKASRFHNGEPFTSADVKASYERIQDEAPAHRHSPSYPRSRRLTPPTIRPLS